MIPSPAEALNLFYPAANAAYGSNNPAHMPIGNDFVFTSQIVVDPAKAALVPPQHLPLLTSMLKMNPVFGFVAKRPGSVLVSIRGTETPEEWLCDFEATPSGCQIASGTVHEGFQKVYEVIRDSALQGLKGVITDGDVVLITGHSLGAALALLFADDVSASKPRVCTFAGPRVGFDDFVASFNQRVPDTLRVVNRWDIVPNVPLPAPPVFRYDHVNTVLNIDGGFTLDLKNAHSLQISYGPGLKKL